MTPPIAPPAIAPILTEEEELDCAWVGVGTEVVVGVRVKPENVVVVLVGTKVMAF